MPKQRRSGRVKKRLAGERGFTLIEIMVAALLLLFAMAGIVPFFLGGLSQASSVRYKSIATNVARERMEEIRQLDYREITENGAEGVTLSDRFGTTAVQRDVTFDVSYAVEEATYEEGTVKKVTVNVGWDSPAGCVGRRHHDPHPPAIPGAARCVAGGRADLSPTRWAHRSRSSPAPPNARYHLAQADWSLVYDNLDQAGMTTARTCMRGLMFFDDDGQSIALGRSR